jgi:WD40 repeat protein
VHGGREMGYDAFVSYSHAVDGRLAPALQRGLQRLARPWYRARASAIFRDETGLAVSPHLWASIVRALDDSEWFVVLCSPEAAVSEWVEREIDHWLARRRTDRILLVLTDGDLVWDRARGDFDAARSTALPPALLGHFGDEPRHLDLRWARGEEQLDVRHARFRTAVAELAAPIRNMARDELEAEDVRQHRRTMRLARGATTVLVLLLVITLTATLVAVQQRRDAQRASAGARREAGTAQAEARRAEAEKHRAEAVAAILGSRQLAENALTAFAGGQHDVGLLLAVSAGRLQSTPQARSALLTGLLVQPTLRKYLHGLGRFPQTVQYSPDGSILAAGTADGVQLWQLKTGRRLARQPKRANTGAYVQQLAFRPDGKVLAVSGSKGLRLLDVATGTLVAAQPTFPAAELEAFPNQSALAWSPDGTMLAGVETAVTPPLSTAKQITVFNATTGQVLRSINAASTALTPFSPSALAFSPDGSLLASESSRGTATQTVGEIQLYDVRTGAPDGPALQSHDGIFTAFRLAFGPNDMLTSVALGRADPVVNVWNLRSRTSTLQRARPAGLPENVVAASPDTRLLASRSDDGSVRLWNTETGAAVGAPLVTSPLLGMPSQLATAAFSPDSKTLAVAADDSKIRLFTSANSNPILAERIDAPPPTTVPPGAGDFTLLGCNSPPGRAAFSRDGPAAFSSDGSMYAFACRSFSGNLIHGALSLWDVRSGTERAHWPVSTNSDFPAGLAFSPDNKTIAVTGDIGSAGKGEVQLWDIATGHTLDKQPPTQVGDVGAVTFSTDGRTLAWTDQGRVVLWDLVQGEQRGTLSPAQGVTALAFSPDGKTLAAANSRGVTIWDLTSGVQIGTPMTTTDAGALMAAAGAVTEVSFDKRGDALTMLVEPTSADPTRSSVAPIALRWTLQTDGWVTDACQIANRNLTRPEWAQYAGPTPYLQACPQPPAGA